jgi:dienelactone hydrolase
MASLIPGYEYDIFISYRQKDNKHDGWVTEFVDNLKGELDSMFKDEVSVYFDINPSDYLLESYDVDASLRDKLKCLVFIPIISRTYCDPKSFAWDNELITFFDKASEDQFGFKIKLPNGNVANRVLPIRIHDLDSSDIKLFESVVGGVLRSIDFVYKETGVSRQLRAKDDDIIKNPGQILYRDQINKVALTVKDIIESMKSHNTPGKSVEKEVQGSGKAEKKKDLLEKPVLVEKSEIKETLRTDKLKLENEERFIRLPVKTKILVPGILIFFAILAILILLLNHRTKVKWAKEKALPEIEQLINKGIITDAFSLVQKTEKYISDEPKFKELSSLVTFKLTLITDPPGADVYIREYSDLEGEWKKLGRTPIDSVKIPGSSFYLTNSFYLTKIEKSGYEDILAVTSTEKDTLYRKLFKQGTLPPGMVYVEGYKRDNKGVHYIENQGFFMDRFEVTNKQYKEFVDKGGYSNPDYWKNEFKKDGKTIERDEAMSYFIDKTGRQGPAAWEAGDYPDGQANNPVSGISWYEAAAYAEYVGKDLPTADHWESGAGLYFQGITFYSKITSISNFNGKGSEPQGKYQGVTFFGAYDMAGNVREWCWNKTQIGHIICGGGWDDPSYRYMSLGQLPSFDRSPQNGFRCVKYIDREKIPESAFRLIDLGAERDFSKEIPVPESTFRIFKNQFLYDSTDLKAVVEERINSYEDWNIEKITFNTAYGKERVITYLYLPKNASPPFQTLIFFPGSGATWEKDLVNNPQTTWFIDYLLKSGRAVMFPVYKGTFERIDESIVWEGHHYTELLISWVKDFQRSIDYLETRSDIDKSKLGYYGHSWGGYLGGIIPAVENRLKISILILGGLGGGFYPEDSPINYVPRINIPVLMLNGKYDYAFQYEKSVLPFFNLLGTPEKDKRLIVYETDHYIPKNEMIKEVLNWLDKYFGPVNHLTNE